MVKINCKTAVTWVGRVVSTSSNDVVSGGTH